MALVEVWYLELSSQYPSYILYELYRICNIISILRKYLLLFWWISVHSENSSQEDKGGLGTMGPKELVT